jgi:hypothetical protein
MLDHFRASVGRIPFLLAYFRVAASRHQPILPTDHSVNVRGWFPVAGSVSSRWPGPPHRVSIRAGPVTRVVGGVVHDARGAVARSDRRRYHRRERCRRPWLRAWLGGRRWTPIWAGRQADLADAVARGEVTANAAARQKGWRPPRIELRDPTVVAARIREHFSREQIDLLIALLRKETYDEPRESVYCRPVEFAARRSRRRSTEARPHRPTRPHLANAVPC